MYFNLLDNSIELWWQHMEKLTFSFPSQVVFAVVALTLMFVIPWTVLYMGFQDDRVWVCTIVVQINLVWRDGVCRLLTYDP